MTNEKEECKACFGRGNRLYANTSTWHYTWGGSAMTPDVCDECWGSGDINNPGEDLRKKIEKKVDN
jgi:DnaJ-class molecular chaperone